MFRNLIGKLTQWSLERIVAQHQRDKDVTRLFWVSFAYADGDSKVVIVKVCCKNHAIWDAGVIAGFPHGLCEAFMAGPMDAASIPESYRGRLLNGQEAELLGGKSVDAHTGHPINDEDDKHVLN